MTSPDPRFSTDTLQRNLRGLRAVDPDLERRLSWPVVGDHVVRDPERGLFYRLHSNSFRLELREAGTALRTGGLSGAVSVFGLGLGEDTAALLARDEVTRIVVWERDPWLVRLALSAHDWHDAIVSGRLVLRLGIDLARHRDELTAGARCEHPTLGAVYARERELLERGVGERRALICEGGLFVPSVGNALRDEGYSVYTLDVERLALEELDLAVARFAPELVFSINYRSGLAEFCAARDVALVCWEIDPTTSFAANEDARTTSIFTYREAHVAAWREAGFARTEYLPLASDPALRAPVELEPDESEQLSCPVSFVGSSMVRSAAGHAERFALSYRTCFPESPPDEATTLLRELLERQRTDFERDLVGPALDELLPEWVESCRRSGLEDPRVLAGEIAASEKRLGWVAALATHGVRVWGDPGWERIAERGVEYRGRAGHARELTLIYRASRINLDVGRLFQSDIVTMRVFDVLATGSFVLAEHSPALERVFDVGREVASYRGLDELREKTAWYLEHPDEAAEIAERGRRAVLDRHTIAGRVRAMLERAGIGQGRGATTSAVPSK